MRERTGLDPLGHVLIGHTVADLVEDGGYEVPGHFIADPEDLTGEPSKIVLFGRGVEGEHATSGEEGVGGLEAGPGRG